ncbi:MAG: hypothetical protein QXI58_01190 [Candidatus Micrarchaeia archaeon]
MNVQELTEKLIKNVKEIEKLQQEIEFLREELKKNTQVGWEMSFDGYVVKHTTIKRTITDPEKLKEVGIDPSRVTVTITKIDPDLVRTVGKKENKPYYTVEERIVVEKK